MEKPIYKEIPPVVEREVVDVVVEHYDGELDSAGRYHGIGKASFKRGGYYQGMFFEGKMHGKGRFTWPDGVSYDGDFENNGIDGEGCYTWQDRAKYRGQVKAGKRHGKGEIAFSDTPARYIGDWDKGIRQGTGTLYYDEQGLSSYCGRWEKDRKNGHGVMRYLSGNSYVGQWRDDEKHGQGTMYWVVGAEGYEPLELVVGANALALPTSPGYSPRGPEGEGGPSEEPLEPVVRFSVVYTGAWEHGLPNGRGEQTWLSIDQTSIEPGDGGGRGGNGHGAAAQGPQYVMSNRYVGAFKDGLRHGFGTFFYATGASYEGEWVDNIKQGHGLFRFEDGSIYEGPFVADRPVADARNEDAPHPIVPETKSVKLHIKDLFKDFPKGGPPSAAHKPTANSTATLDAEGLILRRLDNAILRNHSELRAQYRKYSHGGLSPEPDAEEGAPEAPPTSGGSDTTIRLSQFWKLLYDAGMVTVELPLPRINALIDKAIPRKEAVTFAGIHDPNRGMLYRDFVEAIVRIVHEHKPDLTMLSNQMNEALARITAAKYEGDPARGWASLPAVQAAMEPFDGRVQELFVRAVRKSPPAPQHPREEPAAKGASGDAGGSVVELYMPAVTRSVVACLTEELHCFRGRLPLALFLESLYAASYSSAREHDRRKAAGGVTPLTVPQQVLLMDARVMFWQLQEAFVRCADKLFGRVGKNIADSVKQLMESHLFSSAEEQQSLAEEVEPPQDDEISLGQGHEDGEPLSRDGESEGS